MTSTNVRYNQIRQQLSTTYGWQFQSLTDRMLCSALEQITIEQQVSADYILEQISSNPVIREKLLDKLVIPETCFFRYPESFNYLKTIAKEWLKNAKSNKFRIASIPCATGEEPYSVAMSLLSAGMSNNQFQIDALDISLPLIQKAKQGIYSSKNLARYAQASDSTYFDHHPLGIQIKPFVQQHVNFIHGNITDMPSELFKQQYDVVFCRNLLIYLSTQHRLDLFQQITRMLNPKGVLFVGPVEVNFFKQQGLHSVNRAKVYALTQAIDKVTDRPSNKLANKTPITIKPASKLTNTLNVKSYLTPKTSALCLSEMADKIVEPTFNNSAEKSNEPLDVVRNLADKGDFEQALQLITPLLAKSGGVDVYLTHGEILLALKRLQEATHTFKKVLYLQSKNKQALHYLALLSQRLGEEDNATKYIQRLNSCKED